MAVNVGGRTLETVDWWSFRHLKNKEQGFHAFTQADGMTFDAVLGSSRLVLNRCTLVTTDPSRSTIFSRVHPSKEKTRTFWMKSSNRQYRDWTGFYEARSSAGRGGRRSVF